MSGFQAKHIETLNLPLAQSGGASGFGTMLLLLLFQTIVFVGVCHWAYAFENVAPRPRSHPISSRVARMTVLKSQSHPSETSLVENDNMVREIRELMSQHDPILLFASRLLPADTSRDASALYAWCRRLDEITDDPAADSSEVRQRLSDWEARFDKLCHGQPVDGMDAALAQCLKRHEGALDEAPFREMMAGMTADAVDGRTVATMEELEIYAYQVAGTVGIMLLPLLGANVDQARKPAIALGKAIQLVNVLRDAAPDASELQRIYLPQDMLASEGVSNGDILELTSSEGYCRVVEKVADRAEELLAEAEIGRTTLPGLGPLFVQIIVELYRSYLTKLRHMNYDNLATEGERVKIGIVQKVFVSCKALVAVVPDL